MSNSHNDRNMLFGILALQMDFIDREDLIAAVSAWIKDKTKTLDDILVAQQRLDAKQRDLLQPLVDEHIRRHSDAPQRSLAAISSIGSLREELNSIGDAEVHASLMHVGASKLNEDPDATQPGAVGQSTSRGERFRVLRPHAKGGLGQVSVALDNELNREVALKQIQPLFADNVESRVRFTLEAEITGGLEHPGIVPVYGLGSYPNGRPFYAMRFVRGDSLKQAIQRFHTAPSDGQDFIAGERSVEFRRLVGRFVDVCDAVEYAHSRGVLHRDLKPGNIMLGKHGETLVVDWGLAKAGFGHEESGDSDEASLRPSSESGSAPTQMGSAIGTPHYMSPEQAAGRLDQLGPASDVYSLGATLYSLLTGQPPLPGSEVEEILEQARTADFPTPSTIKSGVPKALEAVCLKAMSLKPVDRYPTARAIAEDIEHWLADEPVSACPDSIGNQVARWLRHHRSLAQAIALALVVVTLVSVVSAVLVDSERRRADRNATDATTARDRAERETQRADENARLASQQRDLTLETLQTLVYEVQDKLGDRPGMQQLKQEILDLAIEGLTKVTRHIDMAAYEERIVAAQREMTHDEINDNVTGYEDDQRATIDHSLAIALRRMGDIFMATGRTQDAQKQFENSHRILQRLADGQPQWTLAQQSLANSHDKLGSVHRRLGLPQQAIEFYEASFRIRETMAAAGPDDPVGRRSLAVSYSNLGDSQLHFDDYPLAFDNYRRAMSIRHELNKASPNDRELRRSLAYALYELGNVTLRIGLEKQAHDHFRRSLDLRLELAATDADDRSLDRIVAAGYTGLGNALLHMEKYEEAHRVFLTRLALAKQSLEEDPQSLRAHRGMKLAYNRIGIVCFRQGRLDEAREYFKHEIEYAEMVAKEDPEDVQWQTFLAASYSNLAMNEIQARNLVEAAAWSAKAVLTEAKIRAAGKVTEWTGVPDWVDVPLKTANPRRNAKRVLTDLRFADSQPRELAKDLLVFRTAVLAGDGKIEDAGRSVAKIELLAGEDAVFWYDAARCHSLCANAARLTSAQENPAQDPAAQDPAAQEKPATEAAYNKHTVAALRCLTTAVKLGFDNASRLKTDPDLRPLRENEGFRQLLAQVTSN